MCSLAENQCDQIWRNFATLAKFKNIWQLYKGLVSIWQTFEPTLENSVCFRPIYVVVSSQILSKHFRHLVTLTAFTYDQTLVGADVKGPNNILPLVKRTL